MGSGGMIVIDDETCIVDVAKFFLEFTQSESCGKCTPCREGTKRMLEILQRITAGQGKMEDIDKLLRLADTIKKPHSVGWGKPRLTRSSAPSNISVVNTKRISVTINALPALASIAFA